jgi:hypothetical protein
MRDDTGYELLKNELEFENWGLCLDTGHLMNFLGHCRDEIQSIDDVLDVVRSYPREMKDRTELMHLHMSLSADYIEGYMKRPVSNEMTSDADMISKAYEHVVNIDQHRPFSDKLCTKMVDAVRPGYVTHEISGADSDKRLSGFKKQLSLFR